MPDVDGIELLRFLRGNDAFAAVPVVSKSPPPGCPCLARLISIWKYACYFIGYTYCSLPVLMLDA